MMLPMIFPNRIHPFTDLKDFEKLGKDMGCPKWADPVKFSTYVLTQRPATNLERYALSLITLIPLIGGFIVAIILYPKILGGVLGWVLMILLFRKAHDACIKRECRIERDQYIKDMNERGERWAARLTKQLMEESEPYDGPHSKPAWDVDD